ncbi:Alpha/Beta hydrolase protein [Aspergillus flavus]|uniref:Alpha/Beta hydrolase protein n=1 Tax=Aspergillus flavus TaxID=5059 RepID=A0A5N6GU48_ASPFL|nr:Alpha/Beta hydrolase protein [Aspergillus flavus]
MSSIDQQKKLNKRICQKYQNSPWPSLAQLQKATSLDTPTPAPARGGVWIARTSFSAPTNPAIRDVLYTVIHRLKKEYHRISPVEETPVIDVGVEFIGPRSQVPDDAPEPDIPEEEKLRALLQECNSELTILYAHGGGLYFSSPAQYRASSIGLAKLTGARVASIKYRLTPSHTFPASILDILVAYASLLYPLAGAPYPAVPADQIILAGNSAGANITLGLMKLLLECDQCDSLPSWHCNGETDILTVLQPACMPGHPTHSIWPASPPREVPYCVAATLDHELVSPAAVEDWTGSPPMWFACGCEERGVNGNRVVASQAAKSGVTVIWNEYEGMPHEFPIFLSALPQIHLLLQLWAAACQAFAGGKIGARELQSGAVRCLMPDCKPMVLGSPVGIAPLPFEEVRKRMEYNATRPDWTGKLHEHKL